MHLCVLLSRRPIPIPSTTHTFDNTPHRLVLPRPPFFWAGCGFTLASFSHTCVCPLVHPLCSSTVTTTQYHSVWTSNGSPSSRATRLLRCFTQVSDMVFTTQLTQSTTHLTAWFCQDPLFFGWVAVLLWLHTCVCVCPLVHPLSSSVPQTVTTTQYHSVWTSNGSPSSRATSLYRCFTQVSDMVFTTRHNRHSGQHDTTTV